MRTCGPASSIWILVSLTLLAAGCAKEPPDPPRHLNPLDPASELQGADPFRLVAELHGESVELSWVRPAMTEIAGWRILRTEEPAFEEPDTLASLDLAVTTYLDAGAAAGERYYYKVIAADRAGRVSASSHLAAVSIETRPIIRIGGDPTYAPSRRVSLTVLATEADSMRIANDAAFTGRPWEVSRASVSDWLLDTGPGAKTVYLQIRYIDGRLSPAVADTVLPQPISPPSLRSEQGTVYFRDLTAPLVVAASGADSAMVWNSGEAIPTGWRAFPAGSDSLLLDWSFAGGEGWKELIARFKDDFLIELGPETTSVAVDLSPPVAVLSVTPADSARGFAVDASASYDEAGVTPAEDILVSWQWEEGGAWSAWTAEKTAHHTYTVFGPKTVRLAVRDGAGRSDTLSYALTAVNRAPTAPADPFPADGAGGQSLLPRLAWSPSTDVDLDVIRYSVYFGSDPDPSEALGVGLSDTTLPAPPLLAGHTYYWTVVAADAMGAESEPARWSFTTNTPSGQSYVLAASWGTRGSGEGQFEVVRDVALDARGRIYASDVNNGRVQIFSLPGVFLREITLLGTDPLQSPSGLAVDGEGSLYVADQNAHRIAKFDSTGQYLWSLGGRGTGDGQFQFPRDVCVDAGGNLYVLDTGNNRVQKFDSARAFLGEWGSRGSGAGEFETPYGLAAAGDSLVVADSFNRRIQKFASDGSFGRSWDGFSEDSVPGAVASDSEGNVFVLESAGILYKFGPGGTLLSTWGGEIGSPADGLWVDPPGNLVWVADTYNHRILVFERQ